MEVEDYMEYNGQCEDDVASLALEASRLRARLRLEARDQIEREVWGEQDLERAAIAFARTGVGGELR